jgi:ferredoxin
MDTETGRLSKKMQALKSTLSCIRIARATSGFTLIDALHAYVYGRRPYWYIGVATGERAPKGFTKPLIKLLFNFLSRFPTDNLKMGCGICVRSCPGDAMKLRWDNTRSDPLELDRLLIKKDGNGNANSGGMR